MYNVFSDDFENPALIYYQNQKSNAIATKITDTVAGTLQNTINETFIKVAATTVFEEGNTVSDQVQGDSYVEEFCSKLEELNDNLKEYSAMIDSFQAVRGWSLPSPMSTMRFPRCRRNWTAPQPV